MKLKELREARRLKAKTLAKACGTDASMVSRFENYKCLPTPDTMERICIALDADVSEIYTNAERIYRHTKDHRKKPKPADKYRLTVDLPIEAQNFLKEALPVCGYKDITYWVWRCYERLQAQYKHITTAPKTDPVWVGVPEDYEAKRANRCTNGYDFGKDEKR